MSTAVLFITWTVHLHLEIHNNNFVSDNDIFLEHSILVNCRIKRRNIGIYGVLTNSLADKKKGTDTFYRPMIEFIQKGFLFYDKPTSFKIGNDKV